MQQVHLIGLSLDEFQKAISINLRNELSQITANFQPKEPNEYLTRNEVSELLKVDLSTVHNWTKRGKLKSMGIGSRVYYKRSEVEQALQPLNV
jgi:excisionase family DNA binding protein